MNYLSHAYRYLDQPYFAAGTCLPDWMSVVDRKNRARRQFAEPVVEHSDPQVSSFAAGVIRHHDDDHWFHQQSAFVTLSTQFAVELRELLEKGMGHQAGFVGHIAVELLLDADLASRHPDLLDQYYDCLKSLDAEAVQSAASSICKRPVTLLTTLLPRFISEGFLYDYLHDDKLLYRLNGVMRRVKLPQLPETVIAWLATARTRVAEHADELLAVPD